MINTHLVDCMEFMKDIPDNYYDLAHVDPEWGRGEHGGTDRTGIVIQKNGSESRVKGGNYKKKDWDSRPVPAEYFPELKRISKHQIIWGINYYDSFLGSGRIIWDKVNEGSDQSDCEIAYNSLTERVDLFRFMWRGMMHGKSIEEGWIQKGDKSKNQKRIHPTEKPIELYKWPLLKYAKPGWKIFDSHGGSFSHAIACYDLGFDLDICEKDPDYYKDSTNRLNTHILKYEEIKEFGFAKSELNKDYPTLF